MLVVPTEIKEIGQPQNPKKRGMKQERDEPQHITAEEVTDILSGTALPDGRRDHLEECEQCKSELEAGRKLVATHRTLVDAEAQRIDTSRIASVVELALRSRKAQ